MPVFILVGRQRFKSLLLAALLVFVTLPSLTACSVLSPAPGQSKISRLNDPWSYADLRLVDPTDAAQAAHDLLAVYIRQSDGGRSSWIDVRLDFLDLSIRNQPDIYITLDYAVGGASQLPLLVEASSTWDALFYIPAYGVIRVVDKTNQPMEGLSARILRDPELDTIELQMDATGLYPTHGAATPPEINLQVFVTPPGARMVADQTPIILSFDPPPKPARLLLAYWNVFPAYTPAQALRRWDGAHTGPLGGRHGMDNLLRTASSAGIPLVLLDLKHPAWLSALDYAGDLERVNLLASDELILPEVVPPTQDAFWRQYSHSLARIFDLPGNLFAYTQSPNNLPAGYQITFYPDARLNPVSALIQQPGQRLLPLPVEAISQAELQPVSSGLSLQARRWLANSAAQGEGNAIIVLGGDLTRSAWGNPQVARAAFGYINAHPWIRPLTAYDLLSMPVSSSPLNTPVVRDQPHFASLPAIDLPGGTSQFSNLISKQPSNPLVEAAAQSYLALAPPSTPASPEYAALQSIYAGQIRILLEAARWSISPVSISSCDVDPDQDGKLECVLASQTLYTVFDPALGTLTHAFAITRGGVHQLIAPSSQFTFGTGDPSTWQPALDLAADPQVIPGAFHDGAGPYQAAISSGELTLSDPAAGIQKRFSLLPDGVLVVYQAGDPLSTHLPLVLDPWERFASGWGERYHGTGSSARWSWSISPALTVEISTNGRIGPSAFTDTREMMNRVENPNTEFPPGHYLPFPLAELEISGDPDFWLEIRITP